MVRAHRSPQQWPCRFSRRAPPEGPPGPIMKASNDGKFCFWHRLFPDFCPSHWPPAPAAPAPATFDNYLAGVAAYHRHSLTLAGSVAQILRNPVQAPAVCSALASLLQISKLPSRAKRPLAWRETQGILEQGFALTPTGRLHSRPLWMLCTLRLLRRGAVVALRSASSQWRSFGTICTSFPLPACISGTQGPTPGPPPGGSAPRPSQRAVHAQSEDGLLLSWPLFQDSQSTATTFLRTRYTACSEAFHRLSAGPSPLQPRGTWSPLGSPSGQRQHG